MNELKHSGARARRTVRDALRSKTALSLLALALGAAPALSQDSDASRPAYWGSPSVDGGKCCQTLGEVRTHIDRLDQQILAAMAERAKYVAEAGRFKKDPAAVSAPARVEAIVSRVRKTAEADNFSPDVAEKTFRAMIAAFEDYERSEWLKGHPAAK